MNISYYVTQRNKMIEKYFNPLQIIEYQYQISGKY